MSGAAAAIAAAIAQAVKASGVIVRVDPANFMEIVKRQPAPLIVHASGGFFLPSHQYLASYKGLAFYATSKESLSLPKDAEVVEAQKIWIPG